MSKENYFFLLNPFNFQKSENYSFLLLKGKTFKRKKTVRFQERQLETLKSQIFEFLLETPATGSSYMCSSVSIIKCLILKFFEPFSEGQTDAK